MKLYPNPVRDNLMVELATDHPYHSYRVIDMTGRIWLRNEINHKSILNINTITLAPGAYMLRLNSDAGNLMHRFIIH